MATTSKLLIAPRSASRNLCITQPQRLQHRLRTLPITFTFTFCKSALHISIHTTQPQNNRTLPSNLRHRRRMLGIRVWRQPLPRKIHAQPVANLLQALRNLEGQADPVGGLLLAKLRLPTACCSEKRPSVIETPIVRGNRPTSRAEQTSKRPRAPGNSIGKRRCKPTRQVGGRLAREGLRCLGRRHKLVHLALQLRKRQQPLDIDHLSARSLAEIFGTRSTDSGQGLCGSR